MNIPSILTLIGKLSKKPKKVLQWKNFIKKWKKHSQLLAVELQVVLPLYINKLGHNAILYEKSDKLGGCKDIIFKNQIYYNGLITLKKTLLIKILKDEEF